VTAVNDGQPPRLVESLEHHFLRYLAMDRGLGLVLALWAMATHVYQIFDAFPYLAITSPTKSCGKTRVAELLEHVCLTPVRTVGISVAALFRTIQLKQPTMIIDEAEALRTRDERSSALREIINAGYRKGQAVLRCDDRQGYEPKEYNTYCPKVLVLIGNLPDTLADRCIPIRMRRHRNELIERYSNRRVRASVAPLKELLPQWAQTQARGIEEWYEANSLVWLADREEELWLPLFAVCAQTAADRLAELEKTARELASEKSSHDSLDWGVKLLSDIRAIFYDLHRDRLSTIELLAHLTTLDESPWATWGHSHELNARGLALLLRPFGIYPQNIRTDSAFSRATCRRASKIPGTVTLHVPLLQPLHRYKAHN
jgi:hypothetical protein